MKEREENKPTTKGRYRTVTVYVCDQKPDSTEINFHKLPLRNGFRAHDMRQSDNRRTVWEFSFKHAQGGYSSHPSNRLLLLLLLPLNTPIKLLIFVSRMFFWLGGWVPSNSQIHLLQSHSTVKGYPARSCLLVEKEKGGC